VDRRAIAPRADWQQKAESVGMIFHHTDGRIYWNESAYYRLTSGDVDLIDMATRELWSRCLDAVQHVIDTRRYAELGIPEQAIPLIETSWNDDHPSIYGRFDLGYRSGEPPRLLEFNADTPTMLLEAAVVQWKWKEEVFPAADQFNSIHEKLIAKWRELKDDMRDPVYFAHGENVEDLMTVTYLRDTAEQAGHATVGLHTQDIGWHHIRGFTDLEENQILSLFKLYPWEWLLREEFGKNIGPGLPYWIEPAWRMILSNKGVLPILWELFPGHVNLLPAFREQGDLREWVKKPRVGREGQNVEVVTATGTESLPGDYGDEGFVYQQYFELPRYDGGQHAIVGSWVIDQEPAGVGIRESEGLITSNESPFVPHIIEDR
jgi:glutathionylspermidine synthase